VRNIFSLSAVLFLPSSLITTLSPLTSYLLRP
jgi:hypothetical protein